MQSRQISSHLISPQEIIEATERIAEGYGLTIRLAVGIGVGSLAVTANTIGVINTTRNMAVNLTRGIRAVL